MLMRKEIDVIYLVENIFKLTIAVMCTRVLKLL